jgi:hypothetical protein
VAADAEMSADATKAVGAAEAAKAEMAATTREEKAAAIGEEKAAVAWRQPRRQQLEVVVMVLLVMPSLVMTSIMGLEKIVDVYRQQRQQW